MSHPGATRPRGERRAVVVAAASLALVVFLLALQPLAGFDTWWHLASGREMERRGELLREDPFTFGAEGKPWLNHEWLWQVGAWRLFDLAAPAGDSPPDAPLPIALESRGASALTIANGLCFALAFVLGLLAMTRAGAPPAVSLLAGIACAWGASPRFLTRPEAATMLLLSLALWFLTRPRPGRASVPGILAGALPVGLAAALGANLHPGVLAVIAVCAAHFAGRLIDALRAARSPNKAAAAGAVAREGAVTLAAAVLGSALNPAGLGLWSVPFELSGIVRAEGWVNPEWLPATPDNAPFLYAAFAAAAGLFALAWVRERSAEFSTLLPACALGLLAAIGYRHIGLFFVTLPFALAHPVRLLLSGRGRTGGGGLLPVAGAAGAGLACVLMLHPPRVGVDPATTPVDAVRFLESSGVAGRLYNDVRFGGYLDWRFPEGRRVLLDGRNELFVPLMTELAGIYSGNSPWQAWEEFVRRERIEGAVVRYLEQRKGVAYPAGPGEPPRTGYRAYSAYLFPPDRWALVYWDDTALVFLRRGGENESVISRYGYEAISPEDAPFQLERASADPRFREVLQKDVARRLAMPPASLRAREIDESLREMGE